MYRRQGGLTGQDECYPSPPRSQCRLRLNKIAQHNATLNRTTRCWIRKTPLDGGGVLPKASCRRPEFCLLWGGGDCCIPSLPAPCCAGSPAPAHKAHPPPLQAAARCLGEGLAPVSLSAEAQAAVAAVEERMVGSTPLLLGFVCSCPCAAQEGQRRRGRQWPRAWLGDGGCSVVLLCSTPLPTWNGPGWAT